MTKTLHERINEAFSSGAVQRPGEAPDAFHARNSAAARKVHELTRELDLPRQLTTDAPEWNPPPGIALNEFARRRLAGLIGDTLPGYPFDEYGRARVARLAPSKLKTRKTNRSRVQ